MVWVRFLVSFLGHPATCRPTNNKMAMNSSKSKKWYIIVKYSLNISKIRATFFQKPTGSAGSPGQAESQQLLYLPPPPENLKMPRLLRCSGMCVGKFFCKCLFVNVFCLLKIAHGTISQFPRTVDPPLLIVGQICLK